MMTIYATILPQIRSMSHKITYKMMYTFNNSEKKNGKKDPRECNKDEENSKIKWKIDGRNRAIRTTYGINLTNWRICSVVCACLARAGLVLSLILCLQTCYMFRTVSYFESLNHSDAIHLK